MEERGEVKKIIFKESCFKNKGSCFKNKGSCLRIKGVV